MLNNQSTNQTKIKTMALTTEKAKQLLSTLMKRNVQKTLNRRYDWKVSRAISTDEPLSLADKKYRQAIIATYNRRLQLVQALNTQNELREILVAF